MTRLDDFVANVAKSGLMAPHDLAHWRAQIDPRPDSDSDLRLARYLVRQGALTAYQARKVLSGATRGFFLGGYRILRPLGEGGMGKVFLAARQSDGHQVAIKVLPPKRALQEEQSLRRFQREMDLSRRVRHPNLALTLEVGCDDDIYFMVMEYIPGASLYELVKGPRGGPLRVPDAARFLLKVLDGLAAAHAAGLIHRDLKPGNIMVTPEGEAKMLDLGLARALEGDDQQPLTRPDAVVGTLDYASPEQLGNAAAADRRSDLYSIGCTLYFMLAGRPPFEGGDVVNKIFKHRMEEPQPLEQVARGVPSAFAAIVRKLMAKDPADRYQSCAELRADLARWTNPERVHAILGAEAEAARAFRPPTPELEDNELRGRSEEDGHSPLSFSIRALGPAEPAADPTHKPASSTFRAVVAPPPPPVLKRRRSSFFARFNPSNDDRWLIHFTAIAVFLGLLAILVITLIRW
jgi:serine/threonine protein kinase